ncbi:TPA: GIY-YIG nuclease family protein [Candidatus Geothermarchaeota archaeon]|nr:GIY-YIG nuclease family protein [Candidatus Geothermarchaeota archaeon]HIQ12796.1 GIY-YIG nuclease family protein [Thermoprotei archaeon]
MKKKIYLLFIYIEKDLTLSVGSLGKILLKNGIYVYIGSGGKNVYKRIERHFKMRKRVRWHIDYITTTKQPFMAWIIEGGDVSEVSIANILMDRYFYIPGFGASDSILNSHLFFLNSMEEVIMLKSYLSALGYQIIIINKTYDPHKLN